MEFIPDQIKIQNGIKIHRFEKENLFKLEFMLFAIERLPSLY